MQCVRHFGNVFKVVTKDYHICSVDSLELLFYGGLREKRGVLIHVNRGSESGESGQEVGVEEAPCSDDHRRYLSVANGSKAVHPMGHPMSHSTQSGLSWPPTWFANCSP